MWHRRQMHFAIGPWFSKLDPWSVMYSRNFHNAVVEIRKRHYQNYNLNYFIIVFL